MPPALDATMRLPPLMLLPPAAAMLSDADVSMPRHNDTTMDNISLCRRHAALAIDIHIILLFGCHAALLLPTRCLFATPLLSAGALMLRACYIVDPPLLSARHAALLYACCAYVIACANRYCWRLRRLRAHGAMLLLPFYFRAATPVSLPRRCLPYAKRRHAPVAAMRCKAHAAAAAGDTNRYRHAFFAFAAATIFRHFDFHAAIRNSAMPR